MRKPTQNVQLKIRMKEPLRAALEMGAKEKGVSLNAETVSRIERSFREEATKDDDFGDKVDYERWHLLRLVADHVAQDLDGSLFNNEEAFERAMGAWRYLLAGGQEKMVDGTPEFVDLPPTTQEGMRAFHRALRGPPAEKAQRTGQRRAGEFLSKVIRAAKE